MVLRGARFFWVDSGSSSFPSIVPAFASVVLCVAEMERRRGVLVCRFKPSFPCEYG